MKRTYVNRLPKDMEVVGTGVSIENGELIVEVEFKEKFEPKDGDFCVDYYGNTFILCEEGNVGVNHGSYALFDRKDGCWIFQKINITRGVRYATEEEKYLFLERLEKEHGKQWNAEKKCLEDIRWKPKNGELFWFVGMDFNVYSTHYVSSFSVDSLRVKTLNCFRTEQAAQKVADQIKEIFKNSKAE